MVARLADYFDNFETPTGKPSIPEPNTRKAAPHPRPENTDLQLWLTKNAPRNVEELNSVRYALYHRCSRAEFTVSEKHDDDFLLSGRQTSVQIVSNKARRYLLWKLRILAREEGWVGRKRIPLVAVG